MLRYLFFLLCCCVGGLMTAQENNYWNAQYGAKSTLLGGAAIASYFDNGAIFYNPSTLCFKDSGNISLSASVYQAENLRINNALGKDLDLNSNNFIFSPQIVSANKQISGKLEVEFILLTRHNIDYDYNLSHANVYSILLDTGSRFNYLGDYNAKNRVIEEWGGFAMSFKLAPKWGLGLVNFFGYRYQKFSQGITAAAVKVDTLNPYTAKYDYSRGVTYSNVNYILKGGLVYHGDHLNWGLTLTLPSVNVFGIGRSQTYIYYSNLAVSNNNSVILFDKAQRLRTHYRTPLSIGTGLSWKALRTKFHLSAEYFAPLKEYELIAPSEHSVFGTNTSASATSGDLLSVRKAAVKVLNYSVGLEHHLKKTRVLLLGFSSDYTYAPEDMQGLNNHYISVYNFNLWHASAGFAFMHNHNNIAVGITSAWGSALNRMQLADFTQPTDATYLLGERKNEASFLYRSMSLVIGLTY